MLREEKCGYIWSFTVQHYSSTGSKQEKGRKETEKKVKCLRFCTSWETAGSMALSTHDEMNGRLNTYVRSTLTY